MKARSWAKTELGIFEEKWMKKPNDRRALSDKDFVIVAHT